MSCIDIVDEMIRIILFFLILTVSLSLSQSQDTECESGYQCQHDCQSYKTATQKLEQYQKGSREYKTIVSKLKSQICNIRLRKICCKVDKECEAGYQCQHNEDC